MASFRTRHSRFLFLCRFPVATNNECTQERTLIASFGATIKTRMRIIELLKRAYEVAKGLSHRASARKKSVRVVSDLEKLDRILKRHLGRRKREKKDCVRCGGGKDVARTPVFT